MYISGEDGNIVPISFELRNRPPKPKRGRFSETSAEAVRPIFVLINRFTRSLCYYATACSLRPKELKPSDNVVLYRLIAQRQSAPSIPVILTSNLTEAEVFQGCYSFLQ